MKHDLLSWNDLKESNFKNQSIDLLLGNGFSRRYSDKFAYESLFDVFLKQCNPPHRDAFKVLGTTNFEDILDFFEKADKLNGCLGGMNGKIPNCIEELKTGLIKAVNQIHPPYSQLSTKRLDTDAEAVYSFENLYTTNYDVIIYHVLMKVNDLHKNNTGEGYKLHDNFSITNGGYLGYNWYRESDVNVFYLHGSLILYEDDMENTYKIKKNNGIELLETLDHAIGRGDIPLFVSEGLSEHKVRRIRHNQYLALCFEHLKTGTNPVLVYGQALIEKSDGHILEALFSHRKQPVIVSVRDDKAEHIVLEHVTRILKSAEHLKYDSTQLFFVKANTVFTA